MHTHPLLSDQTLSFSPQLAATLGLLECLVLTVLNEAARYTHSSNTHIERETLINRLAFLSEAQIVETLNKLQAQGVIYLPQNALVTQNLPQQLHFSFKQNTTKQSGAKPQQSVQQNYQQTASSQQNNWYPSPDTLFRLTQNGISEGFSLSQLDAFILRMSESSYAKQYPDSQFLKYVKQQYVRETQKNVTQKGVFNTQRISNKQNINQHWQPSQAAIEILHVNNEVPMQFIEDTLPEFILYWQERGDASSTWNSKFLNHVRSQWHLVKSNQTNAREPKPIAKDWMPSAACFEVIELAHISQEFAQSSVKEFVLYWMNDGKAFPSWDNKFLQYVKQRWQYMSQSSQGNQHGSTTAQPDYATAQASFERLKDTSWAH